MIQWKTHYEVKILKNFQLHHQVTSLEHTLLDVDLMVHPTDDLSYNLVDIYIGMIYRWTDI